MRGAGRTTVHISVPKLRDTWVVFPVTGTEKPLSAAARRACEEFWQSLDLHGAVMVIDLLSPLGEKAAVRLTPIVCEDRQLTLNVAHRIRDGFLHTRFPLLQKLDGEPHHWATDDPRLVELVNTTRKETPL
jgi:hypothetical protein